MHGRMRNSSITTQKEKTQTKPNKQTIREKSKIQRLKTTIFSLVKQPEPSLPPPLPSRTRVISQSVNTPPFFFFPSSTEITRKRLKKRALTSHSYERTDTVEAKCYSGRGGTRMDIAVVLYTCFFRLTNLVLFVCELGLCKRTNVYFNSAP